MHYVHDRLTNNRLTIYHGVNVQMFQLVLTPKSDIDRIDLKENDIKTVVSVGGINKNIKKKAGKKKKQIPKYLCIHILKLQSKKIKISKSGGSHVSFMGSNWTAKKRIHRGLRGTHVNRGRRDSCPRPLVHLPKSDGGDQFRLKPKISSLINYKLLF